MNCASRRQILAVLNYSKYGDVSYNNNNNNNNKFIIIMIILKGQLEIGVHIID
jgi:hypothetical protein